MKLEFNFPNIITALRVLLTPLVVVLMMSDDVVLVQLSGLIFVVAAISDWYDGWYARRYNAMSPFGRFFDPLADKFLIGAVFFAFEAMGLFALWMVVVIVARDVVVTVLRIVADVKGTPVVTSRLAKLKTALQLIFLSYVVGVHVVGHVAWIVEACGPNVLGSLASDGIVTGGMLVLTALSLVTMIQYLFQNRNIVRSVLNGFLPRTTS